MARCIWYKDESPQLVTARLQLNIVEASAVLGAFLECYDIQKKIGDNFILKLVK